MADKAAYQSNGGQFTCGVVTNTATNTIANSSAAQTATGAGRLCKFFMLTNAINSVTLYDNSTGPGGLILWNSPFNTAPTMYDLQIPFANGIWISCAGNQPQFSFTFALGGAGGVAP